MTSSCLFAETHSLTQSRQMRLWQSTTRTVASQDLEGEISPERHCDFAAGNPQAALREDAGQRSEVGNCRELGPRPIHLEAALTWLFIALPCRSWTRTASQSCSDFGGRGETLDHLDSAHLEEPLLCNFGCSCQRRRSFVTSVDQENRLQRP